MTSILTSLPLTESVALANPRANQSSPAVKNDDIMEAAQDFETAFITQMLTFSGLGKALTLGGGEAVSAFAGFYIESFAEKMTEAGGLGLADQFYTKLLTASELTEEDNSHVDPSKL